MKEHRRTPSRYTGSTSVCSGRWTMPDGMRMQRTRPSVRALALAAGVLTVALGCLTGCAPTPESSPTPTSTPAFASEEEAFAAAEEVYRAYNDAENRSREAEAGDGPPPEQYLVGSAYQVFLEGRESLRLNNLKLEGDIGIIRFQDWSTDLGDSTIEVTATVCLDLTATRTVEASSGVDLSSPSRATVMSQRVTLIHDGDHLLISDESEGEDSSC